MRFKTLVLACLLVQGTALAAYTPPNPNGQATMANSTPVVIASNQTGLPVTGTFWQATQPVSGTFWQVTQPVSGPLTDVQLRATAVPVSGTFFQATQPVSIAATVAVSGPLTDAQLRASAVPVSGAFYQATQPVSGPLTDAQLRASAVPVSLSSTTISGTVAATQSGTWTVQPGNTANTTAWKVDGSAVTQPVSGTFWQATQPVSGTFFQATQPVSIAATVAVSGPLTDAQLRATAVPVSGTVTANAGTNLNTSALALDATLTGGTQRTKLTDGTNNVGMDAGNTAGNETTQDRLKVAAGLRMLDTTQTAGSQMVTAKGDQTSGLWVNVKNTPAVTLASTTITGTVAATQSGTWNIGTVTTLPALPANQSTNVAQINAVTPLMGNGVTGTGSQRVTIASDNTAFSVNATPPTLTKATQGATGYSTQNLKDAGRTALSFYAVAAASGTTGTETAISLTKSSGTGATSAATSWVITNGKRFRITEITVATRGHATATIQSTTFNLRINTAGAVGTTSTPVIFSARSATPATASAWDRYVIPIPDGYEILGDGTLQFGITAAATFTTNAPTWDVNIIGFEY